MGVGLGEGKCNVVWIFSQISPPTNPTLCLIVAEKIYLLMKTITLANFGATRELQTCPTNHIYKILKVCSIISR